MTAALHMNAVRFSAMAAELQRAGFADDDIAWSENIQPPSNAEEFALEAIFVICNSGMKNTVAQQIYDRVVGEMISMGVGSAHHVFGHRGKAEAIDQIWRRQDWFFAQYLAADDKVAFCETLPWIGGITKYHLAKNFGAQVAKPDVHLQRLADLHGVTAQALCERLAAETGFKVATVDLLLWRACAEGILDARTGEIRAWRGGGGPEASGRLL